MYIFILFLLLVNTTLIASNQISNEALEALNAKIQEHYNQNRKCQYQTKPVGPRAYLVERIKFLRDQLLDIQMKLMYLDAQQRNFVYKGQNQEQLQVQNSINNLTTSAKEMNQELSFLVTVLNNLKAEDQFVITPATISKLVIESKTDLHELSVVSEKDDISKNSKINQEDSDSFTIITPSIDPIVELNNLKTEDKSLIVPVTDSKQSPESETDLSQLSAMFEEDDISKNPEINQEDSDSFTIITPSIDPIVELHGVKTIASNQISNEALEALNAKIQEHYNQNKRFAYQTKPVGPKAYLVERIEFLKNQLLDIKMELMSLEAKERNFPYKTNKEQELLEVKKDIKDLTTIAQEMNQELSFLVTVLNNLKAEDQLLITPATISKLVIESKTGLHELSVVSEKDDISKNPEINQEDSDSFTIITPSIDPIVELNNLKTEDQSLIASIMDSEQSSESETDLSKSSAVSEKDDISKNSEIHEKDLNNVAMIELSVHPSDAVKSQDINEKQPVQSIQHMVQTKPVVLPYIDHEPQINNAQSVQSDKFDSLDAKNSDSNKSTDNLHNLSSHKQEASLSTLSASLKENVDPEINTISSTISSVVKSGDVEQNLSPDNSIKSSSTAIKSSEDSKNHKSKDNEDQQIDLEIPNNQLDGNNKIANHQDDLAKQINDLKNELANIKSKLALDKAQYENLQNKDNQSTEQLQLQVQIQEQIDSMKLRKNEIDDKLSKLVTEFNNQILNTSSDSLLNDLIEIESEGETEDETEDETEEDNSEMEESFIISEDETENEKNKDNTEMEGSMEESVVIEEIGNELSTEAGKNDISETSEIIQPVQLVHVAQVKPIVAPLNIVNEPQANDPIANQQQANTQSTQLADEADRLNAKDSNKNKPINNSINSQFSKPKISSSPQNSIVKENTNINKKPPVQPPVQPVIQVKPIVAPLNIVNEPQANAQIANQPQNNNDPIVNEPQNNNVPAAAVIQNERRPIPQNQPASMIPSIWGIIIGVVAVIATVIVTVLTGQ